ncbi:CBS domain-containing protein [Candidatus Bathyarchaeota archaeon]|nr:CBS domain-containing protein [Candidatus Bathyarchaeota archaeon]MCK5631469.1 CBS domain-containing protein [Candidatus Bathyarchaeota archaeon]
MAEIGLRTKMLVRDVMSSPVITTTEGESVEKVAKLMKAQRLGSIIVTDKEDRPIGVITERDLVTRVLSENKLPSDLKAKEVMSSPLVTIKPDETLSNVARQMSRLNMRRFGVVYKGELVGVVSSKDVLAITPELLDTIQEKVRIESGETAPEENSPMAGHCDRCGQWSNRLREIEGEFQCEDCRSQERDKY